MEDGAPFKGFSSELQQLKLGHILRKLRKMEERTIADIAHKME